MKTLTDDLFKKINELDDLANNIRMQISDLLIDLEAHKKELLALVKEIKRG